MGILAMKRLLFILPLVFVFKAWAQFKNAQDQPKTAHEIYLEMTQASFEKDMDTKTYVKNAADPKIKTPPFGPLTEEQMIREEARAASEAELLITDSGKYVMFGGEKEGSSSLITRVMGPNKKLMNKWVMELDDAKQAEFLREFLSGVTSGKYHARDVVDHSGKKIVLDLSDLKNLDYENMSNIELLKKYEIYIDRAGDKSFSHLNPGTRTKIFNGKFPGTEKLQMKKFIVDNYAYNEFTTNYGKAEKFIEAAHSTGVDGWEMNFSPQKSYGEFEGMIDWFRTTLKNAGQKFEAPGHQWVVYPKTKQAVESAEGAAKTLEKLNEIHKNNQAYIVLKAIEGDAGIQHSAHKSVHKDATLLGSHNTVRGVIRLEDNRFKLDQTDSYAIEFRAGTKSDPVRRNTQKFLISRYAAQEMDDLAPAASWVLNDTPSNPYHGWTSTVKKEIGGRYGLNAEESLKFFDQIDKASVVRRGDTRILSKEFLVPLWRWDNAPYLSADKKRALKKLTEKFMRTVLELEKPSSDSVSAALKSWTKVSQLSTDIENYLKPKPKVANIATAHVFPLKPGAKVDVNKIHFGIEYTARFPLKSDADYVAVPGQKKLEWQRTYFDYTRAEKDMTIKKFSQQLAKNLNNNGFTKVENAAAGDGHGHGLDIAYDLKDKDSRKWRVEWDGIGRSYTKDGVMIPESLRAGHVEIVTPKFEPNADDISKVFKAMKSQNMIPSTRFGGGHVNIDLAPFAGKPKEMARFLGAYFDNRNMMSLLFQHPGRAVGAEANDATPSLISKLKNFDGTEDELKKILYEERFFNTRVGRKTKNNQLNMIAYFQDVIPEKFIHEDFDMKNDLWRKTFDVNPKIRKMEFRLFNAPRNEVESALQIKYSKALLNKALNDTSEVFKGNYEVDYAKFAKDPKKAFAEFEKSLTELGLDPKEYKQFFVEGMELAKTHTESPKILTNAEKLAPHPKISGWGKAVAPRIVAISSEGRKFDGVDIVPEARIYKAEQLAAREAGEASRAKPIVLGRLKKVLIAAPESIRGGDPCAITAETLNALMRE